MPKPALPILQIPVLIFYNLSFKHLSTHRLWTGLSYEWLIQYVKQLRFMKYYQTA